MPPDLRLADAAGRSATCSRHPRRRPPTRPPPWPRPPAASAAPGGPAPARAAARTSRAAPPRAGRPTPALPAPPGGLVCGGHEGPFRRARRGHRQRRRVRGTGNLVRTDGRGRARPPRARDAGHPSLSTVPPRTGRAYRERARWRSQAEAPDRQPRRDRRPHHPDVPRAGHPDGRRLLRRRPRRAPRRDGRRGLPDRSGARIGVLPLDRCDPGGRARSPGPRSCTPATGSSRSARSSRRRSRTPASPSSARRRARSRRWATSPPRAGSRTRPGCRSSRAPPSRSTSRQAKKQAPRIGFPLLVKAAFGGGGKGMHVVRDARAPRGVAEARRARGAVLLRAARGLPRALRRSRPPRRGADHRRHARQRLLPRRARLLGAAAPPEADRGDAVAAVRRRAPRAVRARPPSGLADEAGYVNAGTVECIDGRGRRLLLPGDEHPPPGGAHRHRDGDRARPGGAPDRASRSASSWTLRPAPRGARDPVPDQRRGPGPQLPARARAASPATGSRAARSSASTPGIEQGREIPGDYDSMFAKLDRGRTGPRGGSHAGCSAALDEFAVEGVPTTIPVHRWVLESKEFRAGTHTTTWLERALAEVDLPAQPDFASSGADARNRPADILVEVDGRRVPVRIFDERRDAGAEATRWLARRAPRRARPRRDPRADAGHDPEGAGREGPGGRGPAT